MVELPDPNDIYSVADWAELSLAIDADQMSKTEITPIIEGQSGSEPSEAFVDSVWMELSRRADLYSHPFFQVSDSIVDKQSDSEHCMGYLACLLLSLYGVQGSTQEPGKLFEELVRLALKNYLNGDAIVFGWPMSGVTLKPGAGSQILQMVRYVADTLNEQFVEGPRSTYNDRGLDVIGWIPLGDQRSGQIVMLVQCAAGHNWKGKHAVPIDAWCDYIHWSSKPVKAFAVPCIVDSLQWQDRSRDNGMLLDRVRVLNLLPTDLSNQDFFGRLEVWVKEQLDEIR